MNVKKNKKKELPNKIIPIHNSDKTWHESWTEGRNMLNIPHPFRAVLLGKPNSGKSTIVKNLLIRADPPFEDVYVIHCDSKNTKEYIDCGNRVHMLQEIPKPEEWEGKVKTLVVLDDLEFKQMSKDQKRNLDRLVGYCSTHKNISVCVCSQDAFSVPTIVRRCANLFILWAMSDLDSMSRMARKTGLKSHNLYTLFNKILNKPKDSLWVDMSDGSPYPLRKNGFQIITKIDNENQTKKIEDKFIIDN